MVEILPENLRPLSARWATVSRKFSKTRLLKTNLLYNIDLKAGKILPKSLIVKLSRPGILARDGITGSAWIDLKVGNDFNFIQKGGENSIILLLKSIKKHYPTFINKARVKDTLTFEIMYQLL